MPWKIRGVVGERWRLVQALLRKEKSVRDCCRLWGISRKTLYKWRQRFVLGGRRALRDQSRRPKRQPRRLSGRWVRRIRHGRKRHPHWGPKKLQAHFRAHYQNAPGVRTIARWLKRLKLARAPRRRPRPVRVRKQRTWTVARRPNQVWTVDFKGWFRTGNGQRCEPLTVRDLFSRYVLLARLLPTQHGGPVKTVFIGLFRQRGLPEVIRVDNGSPFASNGPGGLSQLSAWWVRLGIRVEFTRPGCPQDNGSHEQFHRVMKQETLGSAATTRLGQQRRTTRWLEHYNRQRPHEALAQKKPAQLYRTSRRRYPGKLPGPKYPPGSSVRQVRSNGEIRWAGRKRFVGEAFVGQTVGLRRQRAGVWKVYYCQIMIGHLHEQDPGAMRPVVYQHPDHRRKTLKV